MKYIIILIACCFVFPVLGQNTDEFKVQVDGLGCPFCAYGLEKTFDEFEGIDDVKIDMETGIMTFTLPADLSVDLEAVSDKVVKAGYTAVESSVVKANGEAAAWDKASSKEPEEDEVPAVTLESTTLMVKGNCGMCKTRIEEAILGLEGVKEASWDEDTQMLSVTFDASAQNMSNVSTTLANLGHDTALDRADDKDYQNLHTCCQYNRN